MRAQSGSPSPSPCASALALALTCTATVATLRYVRADLCDNSSVSWTVKPTVPKGAQRVTDHKHMQIAWSSVDAHGNRCTRVRSFYREDPGVSLPRWVLGIIMDKVLPRGLKALVASAIEYERKQDSRRAEEGKLLA